MNASLAQAVERLRAEGTLSEGQASFFGRVARGELVSVRAEIQVALWAGVTLLATGVGLLVKERLAEIGPVAISLGLALAAAACLWYAARKAAPFSRDAVPSPTLAFDYVLLLGVLLLGSWLAYVETQFKLLGPAWPRHLLVVSIIQLALAYRYDARGVLSLALASFAAWRGVAVSLHGLGTAAGDEEIRVNALLVGALFLAVGQLAQRRDLKAHFEPVYGNLGLALVLGAAVMGLFDNFGAGFLTGWGTLATLLAAATVTLAYRARRSSYFAMGVIAGYLCFLRLVAVSRLGFGGLFFMAGTSFGVLWLILWAHRRFKEAA